MVVRLKYCVARSSRPVNTPLASRKSVLSTARPGGRTFRRTAIDAVISTGGKPCRVAPGDVVEVEERVIVSGGTVESSEVYLIAADHDITVGHPTIANARVVAEVV